jgi:EAL and modified HD-GYP domain-containing signal transduction protein
MERSSAPAATAGQVFVARQGVFDRTRRVVGYELLLHVSGETGGHASLDRSGARVISDAIVAVGLDALAGESRAFVTVSRRLLTEGLPDVLPPKRVILQLASDVEADAEVIEACRALRAAGYALAIDDFSLTPWTVDLVPFATFVKVSAASLDAETRMRLVESEVAGGPALILKDVDTLAVFNEMIAAGAGRYFQGAFLGEPVIKQGRTANGSQLTYFRLLQALNNPNRSLDDLEDLVKADAALCFRLLRTVNSAGFGLRSTVTSIREALLMLGRDTIRRWASLWGLAGLNEQAHDELVATATIRARSCETLAASLPNADAIAPQAFLIGLCSVLDAILERPMPEVLDSLPVSADVKAALLGQDNNLRRLLTCAVAYERGHWQEAVDAATTIRLDPSRLPGAYQDALAWSRELNSQRAASGPAKK